MTSARVQCPYCEKNRIESLDAILRSPGVDWFRCADCKQVWSIPKGADGPPQPTPKAPQHSSFAE